MASESGRSSPDRVASGTLEYRLKNVTNKTFLPHQGVHHTTNELAAPSDSLGGRAQSSSVDGVSSTLALFTGVTLVGISLIPADPHRRSSFLPTLGRAVAAGQAARAPRRL